MKESTFVSFTDPISTMKISLISCYSFFVLLFFSNVVFAQPGGNMPYEERIKKQKLGVHYIPKDLVDAMQTLDRITSEDSKEKYASQSEDFVVRSLFFSFGRWLAINWGMYDGSRFSKFLQDLGVDQPDGQKELVMRAYHRHLNDQDLDIKDLVTRYKAQKAVQDSIKKSKAVIIDQFTRPAKDTVSGQ